MCASRRDSKAASACTFYPWSVSQLECKSETNLQDEEYYVHSSRFPDFWSDVGLALAALLVCRVCIANPINPLAAGLVPLGARIPNRVR
jgi:hypothetical protein